MPAYLLHEWTNSGLPLSGGTLSFFESGTLTPKAVYSTAVGDVSLGSVVTLSASGSATIFLGEGAYRIWLKDAAGVQIAPWVDGIVGSSAGFASGSNASIAIVKTYADLRALTSTPDVVYVCGRTEEGDGGAGLFQLIPLSTLTDDDGIILTAASGTRVYKRVFDAAIDPQWYGVKYLVSQDQAIYLQGALAGSVQFDFPVMTTGSVYISSNITVPNGAGIYCSTDGFFRSGSTITMTFQAGSHFDGISTSFGQGVSPIFATSGICEAIKLSWMGGSDTEKWTKLVGSSTANYVLQADISTSVYSDITVPANFSLDFISAAKLTFTAFANLDIQRFIYSGKSQVIQFDAMSYVGTVNIGSDKCYIEWFGGVSGGDVNTNAIAFKAIAMNGYWDLLINSNYTITNTTGYTSNHELRINGNGSQFTLNQHVNLGGAGIGGLWMTDVTYSYSATGSITCVTSVIKDSYIWGDINCDTNLVYDSLVGNLDNISLATNSKFFNYTGSISGQVSECEIYAYNTININNLISIQNTLIQKTDSTEPQKLPLFNVNNNLKLLQCTIDTNGLIVYSTNESITVSLHACNSPNNFANALSNGYCKVVLTGIGEINNSSAYEIDGYTQENLINIRTLYGPLIASNTEFSIHWRGIGSFASDGEYLVLGASANLSTDKFSANTIRYMGDDLTFDGGGQLDAWLSTIYQFGGQITTEIIYPAGQSPDPDTAIAVWCGTPPIGSVASNGYSYNNVPVTFGESKPVRLPITPGAKLKVKTNCWGGQINVTATNALEGAYTISDIWGDWVQPKPSGNVLVKRMTRVVIYNTGSGVLPAGTRIKMTINPALPNREQYSRFFPNKQFAIYSTNPYYGDVGGQYATTALTSLSGSPYNISTYQLDTPYFFRDCDINGLQVAVARVPVGLPTKTAMDLPVGSWFNGNTINGVYT